MIQKIIEKNQTFSRLFSHKKTDLSVSEPQQVLDGIDATEGLEREILVVHDHPFLALLATELLDVRKHRDWDDYLATVRQVGRHRATLHVEVEFLDA